MSEAKKKVHVETTVVSDAIALSSRNVAVKQSVEAEFVGGMGNAQARNNAAGDSAAFAVRQVISWSNCIL